MTPGPRAAVGRHWEDRAARYLAHQGLDVVARGYRCRLGEIDLVCRDREALVFVEVRARSSGARTRAIESIDAAKQRKLVATARHFLMRHPAWHERPLRFDVVAFDGVDGENATLRWERNVIDC